MCYTRLACRRDLTGLTWDRRIRTFLKLLSWFFLCKLLKYRPKKIWHFLVARIWRPQIADKFVRRPKESPVYYIFCQLTVIKTVHLIEKLHEFEFCQKKSVTWQCQWHIKAVHLIEKPHECESSCLYTHRNDKFTVTIKCLLSAKVNAPPFLIRTR